ncbi:hypothetical protein [uncultured Modestobacter sp.]|nr:hypothetical protein [uncultured Modestobacter sp.]
MTGSVDRAGIRIAAARRPVTDWPLTGADVVRCRCWTGVPATGTLRR